jgi:glucose/arabinose dehydrogenase
VTTKAQGRSESDYAPADRAIAIVGPRTTEQRRSDASRVRRGAEEGFWAITAFLAALLAAAAALVSVSTSALGANSFPSGFSETFVDDGLAEPTAMAFAPNGRLFVTEQDGRMRVIRDGTLLDRPCSPPITSATTSMPT